MRHSKDFIDLEELAVLDKQLRTPLSVGSGTMLVDERDSMYLPHYLSSAFFLFLRYLLYLYCS